MLVNEKRELFMQSKSAYAKRTHDYGAAAMEVCVLIGSPDSLARNRWALMASITTCSLRVTSYDRLLSSILSDLVSLLRLLTRTYYGRVTSTRDTHHHLRAVHQAPWPVQGVHRAVHGQFLLHQESMYGTTAREPRLECC